MIADTVFTLSAPNQISIWYPWQPKYGNPVRPLFSATYSSEHGMGDHFDFASNEEFAEFCETHAARHPYLIENSKTNSEEEPAVQKIIIRAGQWEEDLSRIRVRMWREDEEVPFVDLVLDEWRQRLYREMPAMTLSFLAEENGVTKPPKIYRKDYHNDYNPFLYDLVGEGEK
ncbi:hypothetical protein ACO0M4_23855 [Streptomyces sp. RGM 3693]|uniref:hypothetical protein n=1 Tax=Streptomyces sp. RGM 3693 TaxID=3413284 RepID=UPI003D2986DF